ncbi:cyclase family protein [Kallotenue papyrolyticum]|uniref:cyclase family protein n=1 Tax=Kallotenue papyrolyticum TaxID=1325125 RepID=UPI000492721C|nr:cyclase family protein [Kallotenue papyrolyticum]
MALIDLSHPLEPNMPTYPGLPELRMRAVLTHDEQPAHYAPGTTFQIAAYELGGNTGTYVDAPLHRYRGGADLAALALERLADLPGVVITALRDGPLGPELFSGVELAGRAVLIRTDWSERWGRSDYFRSGPYLTAEACRLLVRAQAALVGIDCANIDNMADPTRPAHSILLAAGIPIVEHLRALDELPPGGFRFFAVPPAIRGGTSFPVRAFAIV